MLHALLLASFLGMTSQIPAPQATAQATTPPAPPAASISAGVLSAQGRMSMTTTTMRAGDFTLYSALNANCKLEMTGPQPPTSAAVAWQVVTRTITATPIELFIHVDWVRTWDANQPATGPSGSTDLRLHPGDRVSLDTAPVPCAMPDHGTYVMVLSVGFATQGIHTGGAQATSSSGGVANIPTPFSTAPGSAAGGVSGRGGAGPFTPNGGVSRLAGGGGGGSGTGPISGPCSTSVPDPQDGIRVFGSTGGCVVARSGFDPATIESVPIELWLVHRMPDGSEESQYRHLVSGPSDYRFSFDPVVVGTPSGVVAVSVLGYVLAQHLDQGTQNLSVGMIRSVTSQGGLSSFGSAGKTIGMPKPDEVIAFELPGDPAQLSSPLRDEFSVRVRVGR